MPQAIIPSDFFIPLDSIKLGRLITNIDHPCNGHHDPPVVDPPRHLVTQRHFYTSLHQNASNRGFGLDLTSFLASGLTKRAKLKVQLATDNVKTYTLDNSDGWFENAMSEAATRSWIERAVDRGNPIYLVTGYHTVTNACVSQETLRGEHASAQLLLPASLSLAATGVIAPLGNLIDPAVGGNRQNLDSAQSQYVAPGEQVCALQYREVTHKWLSSKNIDKLRLSKTPQWLSVEKGRAMEEEDEEDEDVIEVQLKEFDELEGEWDKKELPDGEVLLLRA